MIILMKKSTTGRSVWVYTVAKPNNKEIILLFYLLKVEYFLCVCVHGLIDNLSTITRGDKERKKKSKDPMETSRETRLNCET